MKKLNKKILMIVLLIMLVLSYMESAPGFGAVITIALIIVPNMETIETPKERKTRLRNERRNMYNPK